MKVLVISDYRAYHTTRPEAHIFIGLAKLGLEIHIMTYKEAELVKEFEAAGIRVIDFHPQKKLDKTEISFIRKYIIEEKIEILHLFNSKAIINGIQAAKKLPVKVVVYRGYTGNIHWYDPTSYLKYLHPRVDKIHCNSSGVEEQINRQLFFNKKKTITIPKGHLIEWYQGYQPKDLRKEFDLEENAFLLVCSANNRKFKGLTYLIQAFCSLPDDIPVHLFLLGRDMEREDYKMMITKNRKEGNVHFLGFRSDALEIVSACDVFILSSIYGESLTKSVIEAMALGIAPIITDIPGNRELVKHEENGLVTRAGDSRSLQNAILRVYNDRKLCKILGDNARKYIAEEINTQKTVREMKKLYETSSTEN